MDAQAAWDRLRTIRTMSFEARSRSGADLGWNGTGRGIVRVEEADPDTLLFHEKGVWSPEDRPSLTFNNLFQWHLDRSLPRIRLEHLRFGAGDPLGSIDLVQESDGIWASLEPNAHRGDLYSARMELGQDAVILDWTVTGARKDERITYSYQ